MKVGQLKKLLSEVPDYYTAVLSTSDHSYRTVDIAITTTAIFDREDISEDDVTDLNMDVGFCNKRKNVLLID